VRAPATIVGSRAADVNPFNRPAARARGLAARWFGGKSLAAADEFAGASR